MNPSRAPLPQASIREVRRAVLTPAAIKLGADNAQQSGFRRWLGSRARPPRGEIAEASQHTITGAVYAHGNLAAESLRDAFPDVSPADPQRLARTSRQVDELSGRWLYGGHWMGHFGHFLLETISSLWPEPDPSFVGLVFHRWPAEREAPVRFDWQNWLIQQTGWDIPIHIIEERPARVQNLCIPTRAYRLHRGALPEAVRVWDRIAPQRPSLGPVYLSRSRLAPHQRTTPGDEALDECMRELGCTVVHPQELPIAEQVEIVSRATTIVGPSGSQLHLSIFSRACQRVIEIGDLRLPDTPILDQLLIAAARGHEHHFVPLLRSGDKRDTSATASRVAAIGL